MANGLFYCESLWLVRNAAIHYPEGRHSRLGTSGTTSGIRGRLKAVQQHNGSWPPFPLSVALPEN
jgi:hypothetical protein